MLTTEIYFFEDGDDSPGAISIMHHGPFGEAEFYEPRKTWWFYPKGDNSSAQVKNEAEAVLACVGMGDCWGE